jgi:hypothetical protein
MAFKPRTGTKKNDNKGQASGYKVLESDDDPGDIVVGKKNFEVSWGKFESNGNIYTTIQVSNYFFKKDSNEKAYPLIEDKDGKLRKTKSISIDADCSEEEMTALCNEIMLKWYQANGIEVPDDEER